VVESVDGMTRRLLPETDILVALRYSGGAALLDGDVSRSLPDHALTGLRGTTRRIRTAPGSGLLVARVRPGYAGRFFAPPLHELHGEILSLFDLAGERDVSRVARAVERAADEPRRVAAIEDFFLSLSRAWRPDPVVLAAVDAIDAAWGAVQVGALARGAALSEDAFEKRFRRAVGASPKQYASIVRLRRAVELHAQGHTLTRASAEAGYADQSHFIRQFRRATGAPPRAFFRSEEFCMARTGFVQVAHACRH
jgi:AraC-like DNA-binding protein